MRTKWIIDFSGEKPEEFIELGNNIFMQTRNINEIQYNGEENLSGYSFESRLLSEDVYNAIIEQTNIIKQVVAEQTNAESYQDGYQAAMILLGGVI